MTSLLLSVGDPAGVGPEIAVAAARALGGARDVVLFGDARRLGPAVAGLAGVEVVDCGAVPDEVARASRPTAAGGEAQLRALDAASAAAARGEGALVTGPTSKAAAELAGVAFTGQTEHLARGAGLAADAVTMMFLGPRLKVALATTHVAVRDLTAAVQRGRVERAIDHLAEALAALSIPRPRLAVTGLNPHASEGGLFGDEEARAIAPAIEARASRHDLVGPVGAETAFRWASAGEVAGVVAMFHDQATIASKLLDWGEAVNVTWGLPFVRVSVDHGVAYDAVGRADPRGMIAAMRLAVELTR